MWPVMRIATSIVQLRQKVSQFEYCDCDWDNRDNWDKHFPIGTLYRDLLGSMYKYGYVIPPRDKD